MTWLPLLFSLVLAQSQPATPSQVPGVQGAPLSVMSFNIRYGTADDGENRWEKRRGILFALLRKQRPDVIGLQEALHGQIEEILRAVPGYAYVGVGRTDGRQQGEYAAILYRADRLSVRRADTFWFSDTPGVVKSTSWGNEIERICTWAYLEDRRGPAFYFYNLHLDHRSQPSRERSAGLLLSTVAARDPKAPVIITGDFNAGEANPATRAVAAAFRDSYRVRHADGAEPCTYNDFKPGGTTGEKIDYVFVSPDIEVLAADIVRTSRKGRFPSDHFPVTATLRLR